MDRGDQAGIDFTPGVARGLAPAVFAVGVGAQHGLLDPADFANFSAQLAIFNGKAGDELYPRFHKFAGGLEFLIEFIHPLISAVHAQIGPLRRLTDNGLDTPESFFDRRFQFHRLLG